MPELRPIRPAPEGSWTWLVGGAIGGLLSLAVVLVVHELPVKYVAVLLSGGLFLICLPMIRNLRLVCLYMIITLAPLGLRAAFLRVPHMGGAGAFYIEIVDPFLLLLLAIQVRERWMGFRQGYRFPRTLLPWVGMMTLGLGSVIFMDTLKLTALHELVRMAKLLLLVLVVINEVETREQFRHAVIALILGVILEGVVALTQYGIGSQLGLWFLGELSDEDIRVLSEGTLSTREPVYRVGGLLGHANLLAAYLALLMPTAVALLLAPVSIRLKALLGLALLLGQPTLVLTLSRTGWVDFSVALAIVLVLGSIHPISRKGYLLARIAIVSGTLIVAVALSPLILQRLTYSDSNSVEYRLKWLKTAQGMILDHPLLGTGLNTYVFAQLPYAEQKTPADMQAFYGDYWPAVHNTWVITWAEQGTTGFLLWVTFHFLVIGIAVRNLRIRDPMMHALNVGLLAGFVAIMIDGMTSFFIRQEVTARMFWIVIGLIIAMGYWRRAGEGEAAPPDDPGGPDDGLPARQASDSKGNWLPLEGSFLR